MTKHSQRILISVSMLGLLLALAAGLTHAQGSDPPEAEPGVEGEVAAAAGVSDRITIQGRLTDDSDNPVDGMYGMRFRLYDVPTGGTPLCTFSRPVSVENGLFSTYMMGSGCSIDGRQLYLGVEVEGDGEMRPRQYVDSVPYAWSLRPGAIIRDTSSDHILRVINNGSGMALSVSSETGSGVSVSSNTGYAVSAASLGGTGVFGGSLAGTGVVGSSVAGAAISARGTGVITSTAESYVWISGNDVRKYRQSDSTIVDLDSIGGAIVTPGVAGSRRYVLLPVTVPGPLYGQDVAISALDIYWLGNTDMDVITDIRLRRQTGVCDSCYVDILHDAADHTCWDDDNPQGCTLHYDLTSNNVLTEDSGILYLMMQLAALADDTWIRIGGARLTLEHD